MDLVTRGRLSVQRVGGDAWKAIGQLAEKGGWEEMDLRPKTTKKGKEKESDGDDPSKLKAAPKKRVKSAKTKVVDKEDSESVAEETESPPSKRKVQNVKRKLQDTDLGTQDSLRRSTRVRT
jgi:hypothetical protein